MTLRPPRRAGSSSSTPRGRTRNLRRQIQVPLRADGGLTLVVVADTHSEPHAEATRRIAAVGPDLIVHAGDIGARRVLADLGALAPVYAVRGNIDERAPDLADELILDLTDAAGAVALRLAVLHIGQNGPRLRADATRLARAEGADLLVCGHSHVPFVGRDAGVVVFNPGSIGPRRFHLPIVFGVLEIAAGAMRTRHVCCETGEPWLPAPPRP